MNPYINHTLMMLEDMGMSVRYPEIRHRTFGDDGTSTLASSFCLLVGKRVNIEQNQKMKFMMLFTVLDFYIDTKYPDLEGFSFSKKYKNIPSDNDIEIMLRELFRVAKVIRNSLVHNPSTFDITNNYLFVSYQFNNTYFRVEISLDALRYFYTAIVMYTKEDLGKGSYFLGIIRSVYNNFLTGVCCFSDEFGESLNRPSDGLKIKPYAREIIMNPDYEIEDGLVKINIVEINLPESPALDFYIEHNGGDYLVPIEALGSNFTIGELDLMNEWGHSYPFPPLKKS